VAAREWARLVKNIKSELPGYIVTAMNGDWFETEGGQRQVMRFPRKRVMDIDTLDPTLLYLSYDASKFVTGTGFAIDDGQSL
jgi:NAD(P)-dependent dehydrogenase (short-subunit alcohol dehydrogenase family)